MSDGEEVCRAFRNTGRCRFGDECKFAHSEGEPIEVCDPTNPRPPRPPACNRAPTRMVAFMAVFPRFWAAYRHCRLPEPRWDYAHWGSLGFPLGSHG